MNDLRERREALGISRESLAHNADCSMSMLGMLEQGYRPDRSKVLKRVEAALHNHEPADDRLVKEGGNGARPSE
jgi:predicted transcriptional regulator